MAANSNAISSAHPLRNSLNHLQSHSWYQWTVSHPIKTAVIGIVGTLAALVLYQLFRSLKPYVAPKKIVPPPVPRSALNAQGFIRIHSRCIPQGGERSGYSITEVKVIVEDLQKRRILTRYMPNLEEPGEILSSLPQGEEVQVRLKITKKHPARQNPVIINTDPIAFKVDQKIGRYHIQPTSSSFASIKVEEIDFIHNLYRVSGITYDGSSPTFKPLRIELLEEGGLGGGFDNLKPNTLSLINKTQAHVRAVFVNFKSILCDVKLQRPLSYPLLYPNQIRELELRWLVKDWKAALKLEGIKPAYKTHRGDASKFYVESVAHSSYLMQNNPLL
jgi:hypothetical protein